MIVSSFQTPQVSHPFHFTYQLKSLLQPTHSVFPSSISPLSDTQAKVQTHPKMNNSPSQTPQVSHPFHFMSHETPLIHSSNPQIPSLHSPPLHSPNSHPISYDLHYANTTPSIFLSRDKHMCEGQGQEYPFRSIHQAKSQFLVGQSQLEHVQSLGNDKSSANDRPDSAI